MKREISKCFFLLLDVMFSIVCLNSFLRFSLSVLGDQIVDILVKKRARSNISLAVLVEALQRVTFFVDLPASTLLEIAKVLTYERVTKGTIGTFEIFSCTGRCFYFTSTKSPSFQTW